MRTGAVAFLRSIVGRSSFQACAAHAPQSGAAVLALALAVGAPVAHAQQTVYYTGSKDDAADRLVRVLGGERADYQLTSLSTVLSNHGPVTSGARALSCGHADRVSMAELAATVEGLEVSVAIRQDEEIERAVASAITSVRCVDGGPVDGRVVARLYLIGGVVQAGLGSQPRARERYLAALSLDPALEWPPGFPPSLRASFEDAEVLAASREVIGVRWYPPVLRDGWFDGRHVSRLPTSSTGGTHILQWGEGASHIAVLAFTGASPSIVLPSELDPETTSVDPLAREALVDVLDAAPPQYVVLLRSSVWSVTRRTGQWTELWSAGDAVMVPTETVVRRPFPALQVFGGTGAALALGGGAVTMVASQQARTLAGAHPDACSAAIDRRTTGQVALGTGLVLASVGVGIDLSRKLLADRRERAARRKAALASP